MDGDEDVAVGLVGEPRAVAQRHEAIVAARGDDFESVLDEQRLQSRGDVERDFFFGEVLHRRRAGIVAAVAGVDDDAADR